MLQIFNEINIIADNLNFNLAKLLLSPSLSIQISRFMKGIMAKLQSSIQAEEDLLYTQTVKAACTARKKSRSRVVQKRGVIYIEKVRYSIEVCERSKVERWSLL